MMKQNWVGLKGQDLVEYALLVPFTLAALLLIFDMGWLTYDYSVLFNAAREGTRYASVNFDIDGNSTDCSAEVAATKAYILTRVPGLDPDQVVFDPANFSPADWCTTGGSGEPGSVTIIIKYPFNPIQTRLMELGSLLFESITPGLMQTQSTMNLEY